MSEGLQVAAEEMQPQSAFSFLSSQSLLIGLRSCEEHPHSTDAAVPQLAANKMNCSVLTKKQSRKFLSFIFLP